MQKFFIYDCNGDRVGNPKGYRTIRGAQRQEKIMYPSLWDKLDSARVIRPNETLVCKIILENV